MMKKLIFGKLANIVRNYNSNLEDVLKTLEDFYDLTTDEDKAIELTALYYKETKEAEAKETSEGEQINGK